MPTRLVSRTALLGFLALGICTPAHSQVTTLTVLQQNYFGENGTGTIPGDIDEIRAVNPDVVTLMDGYSYEAYNIATSLGYYVAQNGEGTAVASRYPILAVDGLTSIDHGGLGVTIQLAPDQRIHVWACHLPSTSYGPYLVQQGKTAQQIVSSENTYRMPNLNAVLTLMPHDIASGEPTFLCGDYNAPSDLDYSGIAWPEEPACRNAGLLDSYRILHSGNRLAPPAFAYNDPGITWTPFTQYEPSNAFDRIDFNNYSAASGISPTTSITIDETNSSPNFDSDHRGVLTTYSLTPPARKSTASIPLPATSSTGTQIRPFLSWLPSIGATSHNVFFGTTNPPPSIGNQANSYYNAGLLKPSTKYYWRIDEVTSGGTVTGAVWSFTTGNNASVTSGSASYAVNTPITINFANGPGNTKDWIGIYPAGSPYGSGSSSTNWCYLNGTQTTPNKAIKNGTVKFATGISSKGAYVARFFSNDGYYLMDQVPFTVQ